MFSIKSLFCVPFLGILILNVINTYILTRRQIFSEEDLIRIIRNNINPEISIGDTIEAIHKDLMTRYPGYVVPRGELEFMFLGAGGWNCAIYFLHTSMSETIFVFGTPLDSSGHSGRNWVNKTDVVIRGELSVWREGSLAAETFRAGDVFRYHSGEACVLAFKDNMWKISYVRGFIPFVLPYISSQHLINNHDYLSIFKIYKFFIKAVFQQFVTSTKAY